MLLKSERNAWQVSGRVIKVNSEGRVLMKGEYVSALPVLWKGFLTGRLNPELWAVKEPKLDLVFPFSSHLCHLLSPYRFNMHIWNQITEQRSSRQSVSLATLLETDTRRGANSREIKATDWNYTFTLVCKRNNIWHLPKDN